MTASRLKGGVGNKNVLICTGLRLSEVFEVDQQMEAVGGHGLFGLKRFFCMGYRSIASSGESGI